jgi:hypothetical protein
LKNLRKCDPLPAQISTAKSAQKVKIGGRSSQLAENDEEKRRRRPNGKKKAPTKKTQG